MGKILSIIKSPWGMFAMGMIAGAIVDHRTGGKIIALVAKAPIIGPKVVG